MVGWVDGRIHDTEVIETSTMVAVRVIADMMLRHCENVNAYLAKDFKLELIGEFDD